MDRSPRNASSFEPRCRTSTFSDEPIPPSSSSPVIASLNGQQTPNETLALELHHSKFFLYSIETSSAGMDIWPEMRDWQQSPARYTPVDLPCQQQGSPDAPWTAGTRQTDNNICRQNAVSSVGCRATWPKQQLPNEIYALIAETLSRDDVKAMRLTCREFEYHVSERFFRSNIVPFTSLLFKASYENERDSKGKRKVDPRSPMSTSYHKPAFNSVSAGTNIFQTHGHLVRRLVLSFEIDFVSLISPPAKTTEQSITSFWGEYQWPHSEYQRFGLLNKLEESADDTAKMKAAFSQLTNVRELGVQLDSGLGWLSGPDQSIRSRLLPRKPKVLGNVFGTPERRAVAHHVLWEHLKTWASASSEFELKHCTVISRVLTQSPAAFRGLKEMMVCKPDLPTISADIRQSADPTACSPQFNLALKSVLSKNLADLDMPRTTQSQKSFFEGTDDATQINDVRTFEGGIMVVREDVADHERLNAYPLIPANLTKLQKEWLLETEYAQNAFLSSWIISTIDNRLALASMRTLNFSRLSSHFLPSLTRRDFWDALPQVQDVVFDIIADLQQILKNTVGFVATVRLSPITALSVLQELLQTMIAERANIKSLTLGWADGGEHAQGLTARNKHLMPAAILPEMSVLTAENMVQQALVDRYMIHLPHLTNLTLKNSWITPHALVRFVERHPKLEQLSLESISLTAELSVRQNVNLVALAQLVQAPLPHPQPLVLTAQIPPNIVQANTNAPGATTTNAWTGPHRSGSWPFVLEQISPGRTLLDVGATLSPQNIPSTTPSSALKILTLTSCGYCRFDNPRLDETAIPPLSYAGGSGYFSKRLTVLNRLVLEASSIIHAEIVQCIPLVEGQALTLGFGLRLGWPEEWADEAEAPIYDGCLLGGIGRFTGVITSESRALPAGNEGILL